MKIELIKQTFEDNCRGYKYKPFEWCCDKISSNPVIDFVDKPMNDTCDYNNIIPSVALVHIVEEQDYDSMYKWYDETFYRISHCPFCGEPIEISVVGEEDVSDIYCKLSKLRDELWKKCNRTDSKKKHEELYKKVKDLDDRIEWFYNLYEYKDKSELDYE